MRALSISETEKVGGALMYVETLDGACYDGVAPGATFAVDFGVGLAISAATDNPYLGSAAGAAFSQTGLSSTIGSGIANFVCTSGSVTGGFIDNNTYDNGVSCTANSYGTLGSGYYDR